MNQFCGNCGLEQLQLCYCDGGILHLWIQESIGCTSLFCQYPDCIAKKQQLYMEILIDLSPDLRRVQHKPKPVYLGDIWAIFGRPE